MLSEVERRQHYLDMITGGDVDLKPLAVLCLQDSPSTRPSAMDTAERIKGMKEVCRNKKDRDGMDPILWLAEIEQLLISKEPSQVC